MDPKATWPVVKFIVAATNFKKQDARKLLEEMPEDKYSQLFIEALAWERDTEKQASEKLSTIVGTHSFVTLIEATRRARHPATVAEQKKETKEAEEPRRSTKKQSRR